MNPDEKRKLIDLLSRIGFAPGIECKGIEKCECKHCLLLMLIAQTVFLARQESLDTVIHEYTDKKENPIKMLKTLQVMWKHVNTLNEYNYLPEPESPFKVHCPVEIQPERH